MDYQIITFSKDTYPDQNVWDVCDQQLEKHLSQAENGIAIILLEEMTSGIDLLNWLSKWQHKCENSSKQFFIITEDTDQQECIEFSHPDLNLIYFSSKEEFLNTYPQFSQNVQNKHGTSDASNPVFDFNYTTIPSNVEDKISYPEVVKDDYEIIDSGNTNDFISNDSLSESDDIRENYDNPDNSTHSVTSTEDTVVESVERKNQTQNPIPVTAQENIDPTTTTNDLPTSENHIEEKISNSSNKNEIANNLDLDVTEKINKRIDALIEEKVNDYFEKKYISDNSNDHIQKKNSYDISKKDKDEQRINCIDTSEDKKSTQGEKIVQESDSVESDEINNKPFVLKENRTLINVGSTIEIAGEYECCKCKFKRMYVKGDVAIKCENPECLSSISGWELSFDLF